MSRSSSSPPPAPPVDLVLWFSRLSRAVSEQDYLIANVAREKLAEFGWQIRFAPGRGSRPKAPDAHQPVAGRKEGRR
jgi:hypothetical protein